jgi:hypothetical protein
LNPCFLFQSDNGAVRKGRLPKQGKLFVHDPNRIFRDEDDAKNTQYPLVKEDQKQHEHDPQEEGEQRGW